MAEQVAIDSGAVSLPGSLTVPADASGIVVFAHGSGSSRLSRRNIAVADALARRGCATLLFDLLTDTEAADRRNVFDIGLLGERVTAASEWLYKSGDAGRLPMAYFGASTGAAAALVAAAERGDEVAAVVSRGGRPDLAGAALARVTAPTLLLVGSRDTDVLHLNRQAQRAMRCRSSLEIVDGAGHLFEESGTLEAVAEAAGDWFLEAFRPN